MKAILIVPSTDGPLLQLQSDVPTPIPKFGEVLVRVKTAGLNFADLRRAATHYGHNGEQNLPIAGLELAGVVEECAEGVSRFKPGDRVMAMASKSYAEFACVDSRLAVKVPNELDWHQAAATCVSFMTAHDALMSNANLQAGESVLVQAASSSAGIAAVQLAREFGAARVFGTSTSTEKLGRLASFGLTNPINVRSSDFVKVVQSETANKGVNVVIDHVGGSVLPGNLECSSVLGRIISVGRLGEHSGLLNLDELARKRVRLIGVTFRSRTVEEHAEVVAAFERDVVPLLASGKVVPQVDRVFPLGEAEAAQSYMRTNQHFGKVVLGVDA